MNTASSKTRSGRVQDGIVNKQNDPIYLSLMEDELPASAWPMWPPTPPANHRRAGSGALPAGF